MGSDVKDEDLLNAEDAEMQGDKKPGSAGAGLPRSEDMSHELWSWLQKTLLEKNICLETNIQNVHNENIYRCVTYIYIYILVRQKVL